MVFSNFLRGAIAVSCLGFAVGHMGISNPVPLDAAVGDNYRSPVIPGNNPCHGKGAGAMYTWLWTPTSSGQCEIYQNCFSNLPESGSLRMSFGAAHNGGPCKLYKCTGEIGLPACTRLSLPDTFGTCTAIATDDGCTLKGSLTYTSGGGGGADTTTALPDPADEKPFPDGATETKIRCGSSWLDANGKCGQLCRKNEDCTTAGEGCYADLQNCPAGTGSATPEDKPTRDLSGIASTCVSKQGHITDDFCKSKKCDAVFKEYCGTGTSQTYSGLTVKSCEPYATFVGETWADVALIYDVGVDGLKANNPGITGELVANTVVEIQGDCTIARQQALASGALSTVATCWAVASPLAALLMSLLP